jgi:ATP-dependent Clp protease ATP-binding subunit ClpX
MVHSRKLRCSFCGKSEDQVSKLVAGPKVYICNECVAIAVRIMKNDSSSDVATGKRSPLLWEELKDR